MTLVLATCQFPTSPDVDSNARHVRELLGEAHARGATLAHFPEGALSGYAGHDFASTAELDWEHLVARTREVFVRAGELGLWLVVGSTHRLSTPHLPHNSVYVVDPTGRLVDRYDKRFCAGAGPGDAELANYTPGDHPVDLEVGGVHATIHVCHEYRYPELVRTGVARGAGLVLHSFHAAAQSPERYAAMQAGVGPEHAAASRGETLPEITMLASMIAAAASSHVWVSGANSSTPTSCFGSFVVRPDGVVVGQLERHATGMLVTTIDPDAAFYDSTRAWRARAMAGRLHSGELVDDARSKDRGAL